MLIEVGTFEDYLAALPDQRKEAVERLHQEILNQLPPGFEVGVLGGMINYYVPLSAEPCWLSLHSRRAPAFSGLGFSKKSYCPLPYGTLYGRGTGHLVRKGISGAGAHQAGYGQVLHSHEKSQAHSLCLDWRICWEDVYGALYLAL